MRYCIFSLCCFGCAQGNWISVSLSTLAFFSLGLPAFLSAFADSAPSCCSWASVLSLHFLQCLTCQGGADSKHVSWFLQSLRRVVIRFSCASFGLPEPTGYANLEPCGWTGQPVLCVLYCGHTAFSDFRLDAQQLLLLLPWTFEKQWGFVRNICPLEDLLVLRLLEFHMEFLFESLLESWPQLPLVRPQWHAGYTAELLEQNLDTCLQLSAFPACIPPVRFFASKTLFFTSILLQLHRMLLAKLWTLFLQIMQEALNLRLQVQMRPWFLHWNHEHWMKSGKKGLLRNPLSRDILRSFWGISGRTLPWPDPRFKQEAPGVFL